MRHVLLPLFAGLVVLANGSSARADDKCEMFGEISVEAVKASAMSKCAKGNKLACALAVVLSTGDKVAKKTTQAGCEYTVKLVDKVYQLTIKADNKKAVEEAEKALKALKEDGYRPTKK